MVSDQEIEAMEAFDFGMNHTINAVMQLTIQAIDKDVLPKLTGAELQLISKLSKAVKEYESWQKTKQSISRT